MLMTDSVFSFIRVCLRSSAVPLVVALATAAAPVSAAERFGSGLLWRIEGDRAPASHVFGTVHVADSRVTRLPAPVARELNRARSLSLEVTLDSANILALANSMVYTDGRDLSGVAGAELYGKTAALTAGLGLPDPLLRMFKPWAVALVLSAPPQDPAGVLDFMLARIATEQGKPVRELEGIDAQVAVLESIPEAEQVALLRHAVDNRERLGYFVGRVIEAYLARDLAAMWRISEESAGKGEDVQRLNEVFARRLIFERNARMAERMEPLLAEGGAFIAVGALHLYGSQGVLALLEGRGYRVTRIY